MVPLGINEALTPLSLPNSINIYIDPRGTLFGAALLCFTLPALLVKSVIDHCTSICVGCVTGICYRIGLVQKDSFCTLLPNALTIFDSILFPYVHNPNALRLTECVVKEGKILILQVS